MLFLAACGGGGGGGDGAPATSGAPDAKPEDETKDDAVQIARPAAPASPPSKPPSKPSVVTPPKESSDRPNPGNEDFSQPDPPANPITDVDEAPTAIRVTNIHGPMPENTIMSRNTRLATIEVDDPDRNPAFRDWRDWNVTLSPDHARILEIREVGGSLGLYFRRDMAPDFEMPASWTIPVGIAGTTLSANAVLPVENRNDPTTGTIDVSNGTATIVTATLGTRVIALPRLQDQDGDLSYTYRWVDVNDADGNTLSGRAYFTPQATGRYKVIVTAKTDGFPETPFEAEITITNPVASAGAVITRTITLNENSPRYKPVFDAAGDGSFTLTDGYGDNHLFSVTADGRIWFTGGGPRDMLNFERPVDADRDNVYDIQMVRSFGTGQTQTFNLRLQITDLKHEHQLSDNDASHKAFFTLQRSDQEHAAAQTNFQGFDLILGPTWHMPRTGPLEITWSLITPWSEDGPATRSARGFRSQDDHQPVYTPSQSFIQQRIDLARNAILRALAEFEAATNVRFVEVGEDDHTTGDIRFLFGNHQAGEGRSTGPGIAVRNTAFLQEGSVIALGTRDTGLDFFDYWVLVHEIGHSMGLAHPFHQPGSNRINQGALYSPNTIMSYLDRPHLIDGALTDADIAALQFLYGRPGTNFDGVESRLRTPAPVMELRLTRHEIVLDENTVTREMKLADFTIVGGSAAANHPVFRIGDRSIFELRQDGDSWSLWLRGGQQLDYEKATGYLALFSEASSSIKLLNPAYFRVKVRDIDEVPTAMTLASPSVSRDEAIYPNGQKLTDIRVTDDALGTYTLSLAAGTPDIFELRHSAADGWSLWIRAGAVVDFEALGGTLHAVINMQASGTGTLPAQQTFALTVADVFERVDALSLTGAMTEWQDGVSLSAGTKLADITLVGPNHVGRTGREGGIRLEGDDRDLFTVVDGELHLARDITPDAATKASYFVRLFSDNAQRLVDYEIRVVSAQQSAGSQSQAGQAGQAPPFEALDNGLDDPLQDPLPLNLDVV